MKPLQAFTTLQRINHWLPAAILGLTAGLAAGAAHAHPLAQPVVEPLLGHMINQTGVMIQTRNGGCTTKESFTIQRENQAGLHVLTFVRINGDPCLAMFPYGRVLTFTFEELGLQEGDRILINNPDHGVTVFGN